VDFFTKTAELRDPATLAAIDLAAHPTIGGNAHSHATMDGEFWQAEGH